MNHWHKFPDVPAPVGPVLVTSASKVVWMADFAPSENVWRVGAGRDMVKLPPEAITHWMPLPAPAGMDGVTGAQAPSEREPHFREHIDFYADKHPSLLVRQLAAELRRAWCPHGVGEVPDA